ncbi:PLP-dependent transferase [Pyrrhoderma noxium]|uniref:PLP-dependent transferase n=1 Tax=Pyrrhoderma noxium TaxID=2282107 RepID=A0A286UAI7_9AGAM|nr:PLP-dependent transferase [Pyrrhoderma noxium]
MEIPKVDMSESPPAFGHPMLKYFVLDPSYINLNNGSYGTLPLPVLRDSEERAREVEKNPDRFMRLTYTPLLKESRNKVAQFLEVDTDDIVLVPNATHGVNTVLRNFIWNKDDVIIFNGVTYPAVSRTIRYIADINPEVQLKPYSLEFPTTSAKILEGFRAHLRSVPRFPGQKVVSVIDSIVSNPGVLLPWKAMAQICKEEGVLSVIDAAHSIGQEFEINLKQSDPDFWVSNCHKWLYTKRGCAVLYVPKRNQHYIKSTLPTSTYYSSPNDGPGAPEPPNFVNQFAWTGTHDVTTYLSIPAAIDFRRWIGGEEAINEYCHNLALKGGRRLADILGTAVLDENGEFTAHMVNVELPLTVTGAPLEIASKVRDILLNDWNIFSQTFFHNGKWWSRSSVQIFNEISDFERLGEAYKHVCETLNNGDK